MDLHQVSARFDRTPMFDAYTGRRLKAKCQVTAWDVPKRDGMTTIRRTFYVRAGSVLPNRHAVIVGGDVWIVARLSNIDTWGRHIARVGYVAQYAKAGKTAAVDEVLSDGGEPVYLSRVWVKDVKDISTTSEGQGQYYVYFTDGEPVKEGGFVFSDGRWHIVRNIVQGTAGLMVAECNELEPDCVREIVLTDTGEFDPVTETYISPQEVRIKVVLMGWRDDYDHALPSREPEQVGDKRLRVPAADADWFTPDTRLSLDGVMWQVVTVDGRRDGSKSVVIRRV